MVTIKELSTRFVELNDCCIHAPQWSTDDVDKIFYSNYPDDFPFAQDEQFTICVLLKNGKIGLWSESADYTGHGCRCNTAVLKYDNLRELLINGIESWQRDVFEEVIKAWVRQS